MRFLALLFLAIIGFSSGIAISGYQQGLRGRALVDYIIEAWFDGFKLVRSWAVSGIAFVKTKLGK